MQGSGVLISVRIRANLIAPRVDSDDARCSSLQSKAIYDFFSRCSALNVYELLSTFSAVSARSKDLAYSLLSKME